MNKIVPFVKKELEKDKITILLDVSKYPKGWHDIFVTVGDLKKILKNIPEDFSISFILPHLEGEIADGPNYEEDHFYEFEELQEECLGIGKVSCYVSESGSGEIVFEPRLDTIKGLHFRRRWVVE